MGLNLYIFFVVSFPYYVLMWRCPMVISFPCNDEAGKVLLPQEHLNLTPTPKGEGGEL
jgi:hypothetical protein